jgi:hypothetical protein
MAWTRRVPVQVAKGIGILVAAVLLFLAGSIVFFTIGRRSDVAAQRRRVENLSAQQAVGPAASLSADRAIPDGLPLDRLRMIGTHNSYRSRADALRLFFIGLAQPGEPARLDYTHPPLTDQLNDGVRSFELDIRYRAGRFEIAHVPLVDNRTPEPDLGLALEEISLWSDRNAGHVPVILLFEVKDDYMFLEPGLRKMGGPELDRLDALLRQELGSRLFTPDDVRGGAPTLPEALRLRGWPTVGSLRGRVMAILHEDETYRVPYVAGHPALEGRAMFTCAPPGSPDAGVAVADDPVADAARIKGLVARRSIVRTRADGDGVHGPAGLEAALSSGAQIVSTDFPPAYPAADGYRASFAGGSLLDARP